MDCMTIHAWCDLEPYRGRMLQIGDTIKCTDSADMVDTMENLSLDGYDTDFVYELSGEKGYWLKITEVPGE